MSLQYLRGGIPRYMSGTANATEWSKHEVPGGVANALVLKNNGSVVLNVALSEEDAAAGIGWPIPAGETIGPWPAEVASIWTKSASATAGWVAMAFVRRG
jgi:hypothetical protein